MTYQVSDKCLCWLGHADCRGCSGYPSALHEPACGWEWNPECPEHGSNHASRAYECDNDNHEIGCQCPGNVSQLQQVRELANGASWQANAETPQKFHQFLVSLLKASGGFEPDNI